MRQSLLLLAVVSATGAAEEYVNPCEEFDTAKKLNDLFYYEAPTKNEEEEEQSSYYTSGFFAHGQDAGGGDGISAITTVLTPGKYYGLPTQNFTIGSELLISPVCPVEVTQDGEYPWYCPSPLSINAGVISFTYIRSDIAPPVSILEGYKEMGKDPYTNSTDKPSPGVWDGPGYILSPVLSNPDIIQHTSASSFWDNDRVGYSFTTDGATWNRIDCGNGPARAELLLGDSVPFIGAGPIVDPANDVIMQCSPRTEAWEKYASMPEGWNETNYCPAETFDDYETYIEYNYNKLSTYLSSIVDEETCNEFKEKIFSGVLDRESLDTNKTELSVQCEVLDQPQQVMCGVPPSKFDSIYVPAQKYKNWPTRRQQMAEAGGSFTTGHRETAIQPWSGIGFNEFGQHMVFYANYEDEESIEEALEHAKDFYEKSQLGGSSPIRVPVVVMNPDSMWLDDDDQDTQQQPPPFTCPPTSRTNGREGGSNEAAASGSFLQVGGNNILISAFFVLAVSLL